MFDYVAAILDQHEASELKKLIDITEPPRHEYQAVFAEAGPAGLGGRFPRLLCGCEFVSSHSEVQLMIEEPNWNGKLIDMDRYPILSTRSPQSERPSRTQTLHLFVLTLKPKK